MWNQGELIGAYLEGMRRADELVPGAVERIKANVGPHAKLGDVIRYAHGRGRGLLNPERTTDPSPVAPLRRMLERLGAKAEARDRWYAELAVDLAPYGPQSGDDVEGAADALAGLGERVAERLARMPRATLNLGLEGPLRPPYHDAWGERRLAILQEMRRMGLVDYGADLDAVAAQERDLVATDMGAVASALLARLAADGLLRRDPDGLERAVLTNSATWRKPDPEARDALLATGRYGSLGPSGSRSGGARYPRM